MRDQNQHVLRIQSQIIGQPQHGVDLVCGKQLAKQILTFPQQLGGLGSCLKQIAKLCGGIFGQVVALFEQRGRICAHVLGLGNSRLRLRLGLRLWLSLLLGSCRLRGMLLFVLGHAQHASAAPKGDRRTRLLGRAICGTRHSLCPCFCAPSVAQLCIRQKCYQHRNIGFLGLGQHLRRLLRQRDHAVSILYH